MSQEDCSAQQIRRTFSISLLSWYQKHARTFLWRTEHPDPYHVWLSEMMLQQTTTQTVTPYFRSFVESWPSFEALSKASLSDVLGCWQGLGYYRRAENVLACACVVAKDYSGVLPREEKVLQTLPGVGPYTAAAIASIAFERPSVAVDGNIARVFSRILCLPYVKPELIRRVRIEAQAFLPKEKTLKISNFERPFGDYTQALMDLGATICTARAPKCALCPVKMVCGAHLKGQEKMFPLKEAKKKLPQKYGHFFFVTRKTDGALLMVQEEKRLLKGLWRPLTDVWCEGATSNERPLEATWHTVGYVKHTFTHFHLSLTLLSCVVSSKSVCVKGTWVLPHEVEKYPLSTLTKKALKYYNAFRGQAAVQAIVKVS